MNKITVAAQKSYRQIFNITFDTQFPPRTPPATVLIKD